MKKIRCRLILFFIVIGLFIYILTSGLSQTSVNFAFAQGDNNYISSVHECGIWILNKANRKMMYFQFMKQDKTFMSDSISIPLDFNLNKCHLLAFGRRGKAVLLFDESSGLLEAYMANKDRSIEKVVKFPYGKNFMLSGKKVNFWILNKTNRELIFTHYENKTKIKVSPPVNIPDNFNLENCCMKQVGGKGEGLFLFDSSTNSITFYKIDTTNWIIKEYMNVDLESYLT